MQKLDCTTATVAWNGKVIKESTGCKVVLDILLLNCMQ